MNDDLAQKINLAMCSEQRTLQNLFALASDSAAWEAFNSQLERSISQCEQRLLNRPPVTFPLELPVSQQREQIIAALQKHQVIVVAGETGSGKTTQLPKICLEIGRGSRGIIGHTQPRRVAARVVANRIAAELNSPLGKYVGYKIRFTDKVDEEAYIKLMTDGILLAELQHDPFLSRYDTLIIDEAHERSLNIDFVLGYLKKLLPRRPDLKVIVTSATLEPGRFSSYFNQAPILEISGRAYPVEIVYKPLTDTTDADQLTAIVAAVKEIDNYDRGDILIFLSSEREIHDTAQALRKQNFLHTEILPLYARLSVTEQNKIFQPHSDRRVILATNVAETSVTVPGICYVIDPGYARIKRYSYRTKIQRLPIEPISQASAKQRAGRCGRIAPGVCIRLYSIEDFQSRPEFTEPEILRSNLATVILQMTNLALGKVEEFPFINPPDSRLIRDGYRLLEELGAIQADRRLTKLGKQLAKIPLDPRLGRMLIAAGGLGCLQELLIISSGLSIQDPRERPQQWQQAATQKHQQYYDQKSDFLSYLKLWDTVKSQQQQLSNTKFSQFCRDNFLSPLRLREWQDVYQQLTESIKELRLRCNQLPADYNVIHQAILSGLLSHIGFQYEVGIYLGARNIKFSIFPGSALVKKKPKWLMAVEIVETSRLYARTVAQIEPEWLENLADHLIKRSYVEPHWEKRRNQVVASEKKVLYGLVINAAKKVNYGPIDSVAAREIFIREALVLGEFQIDATFFKHNLNLLAEIDELEQRARRKDIKVDEETLFSFYAEYIPAAVYDGILFLKWYQALTQQEQQVLFLTPAYLVNQEKAAAIIEQFPIQILFKNVTLKLQYRFEPGHSDDGVTAIIPIALLNQLETWRFSWLVPGLLKQKVIALLKALPKKLRRSFVPATDYADACIAALAEEATALPLTAALAKQLERISGVKLTVDVWQSIELESYLLMNFVIIDNDNQQLATGRDLDKLREQLSGKAQTNLQSLTSVAWERDKLIAWDFDELPEAVEIQQAALSVTAYPAIQAYQAHVALRLLADKALATETTYYGLRKLFELAVAKQLNFYKKNIPQLTRLAMGYLPLGQREKLIQELCHTAIQITFLSQYETIRSKTAFENCLNANLNYLMVHANQLASLVLAILELYQIIKKFMLGSPLQIPEDVKIQLSELIYANFISNTPWYWLQRYPVYLKAIEIRLQKLPKNQFKDKLYGTELVQLWQRYSQHVGVKAPICQNLAEFRWLMEEYRISLFAQELKTIQPISIKRLNKIWDEHICQIGRN